MKLRFRPREIARTGDDSPVNSLAGYVWRMTGWHQVAICLLAIIVSLLNLVPIDLQRRIVDGPITDQDLDGLIRLGLIYLGVLVVHRGLKLTLALAQGWLAESVVFYTREHLIGLYRARDPEDQKSGEAVSIVNMEVDKLGGFAGEATSQAFANIAMLVGIMAYMFVVSPKVAAISLMLLIPQVVLTPIIQRRLNRLSKRRLELMRNLGDHLSDETDEEALGLLYRVFSNRMGFQFWKFLMKAILNTLNLLAPLAVLVWGGYLVIQGETTVGVLVAFVSGFDRLSSPMRELLTFYRTAAQASVQHNAIAKWMQNEKNRNDSET